MLATPIPRPIKSLPSMSTQISYANVMISVPITNKKSEKEIQDYQMFLDELKRGEICPDDEDPLGTAPVIAPVADVAPDGEEDADGDIDMNKNGNAQFPGVGDVLNGGAVPVLMEDVNSPLPAAADLGAPAASSG